MSDLLTATENEQKAGVKRRGKPNPLQDMGPAPSTERVERKPGRWRRTKQVGMTGKVLPELIERIEYRLRLTGGTTLLEMAADLQNRFGSDQSPDSDDDEVMKKARIEQRDKERGLYMAQVKKYLAETYGEEIRDDHGRLVGLGDQIEVTRGHYRRVY